jgi:hypothetical protein
MKQLSQEIREENAAKKSQMFDRTAVKRQGKQCRMSIASTSSVASTSSNTSNFTQATAMTAATWSHPARASATRGNWATESVLSSRSLPSYLNSMNLPALTALDDTWFSQVIDTTPFCHGGTVLHEGRHLDVRAGITLKYGVDCSGPEHPVPDITYRLPNNQDSPTGKRVKPPTRYNGYMSPYADSRLKTNRGGFLDIDSWAKSLPAQRTSPSKTLRLAATAKFAPSRQAAA